MLLSCYSSLSDVESLPGFFGARQEQVTAFSSLGDLGCRPSTAAEASSGNVTKKSLETSLHRHIPYRNSLASRVMFSFVLLCRVERQQLSHAKRDPETITSLKIGNEKRELSEPLPAHYKLSNYCILFFVKTFKSTLLDSSATSPRKVLGLNPNL